MSHGEVPVTKDGPGGRKPKKKCCKNCTGGRAVTLCLGPQAPPYAAIKAVCV
jgi:hypothetical protein